MNNATGFGDVSRALHVGDARAAHAALAPAAAPASAASVDGGTF